MTTNGDSNVEDADMAECDGEKVVTMMDVLQEEQDFEDDANAVLGASDEKNCTYSKGYVKRQAIYACLTCCAEAKYDPTKRAGVCLACSLNCHENHELVELYTKRNFRCDCGNPKFNSHPCQFTPNKNDLNEDNNYNQNFSGLYCTCHRPYPDPESTIDDDEMIQCIICEDWLHASHLDAAVPGIDQYSEIVCKACMEKNDFLHDYSHLAVNIETQDVDIVEINGTDTKLSNGDVNTEKLVNGTNDSSIVTAEKFSDNMDVDKALIEDKPSMENDENMGNSMSKELIIESEEKETDVKMETENTEEPSENTSNVNTETKNDSNTDITTEESPKYSENTLEESTTVAEDKAEETANVTSENTTNVTSEEETTVTSATAESTSEPQESKETLLENIEETKDSPESEDSKEVKADQDLESAKQVNSEQSENNNETIENTQDVKDEALKITSDMSSEQEETSITTNEDTKTNISENEQEEFTSITTNENEDTKTNISENDNVINNSSNESPEIDNSDLPQDTNKADNTVTDEISNDTVSKVEMITKESDTPIGLNTGESEAKIDEPSETQVEESKEMKRKLSTEEAAVTDDHIVKKPKLNVETCIRPKGVKRVYKGATFWPSNLRQKLCTCSECLSMYKDLSVLFLIDPEDTVSAYEIIGRERVDGRATQYEKGLVALSSLDRIQQINALTEYNKMKDKLLDFLKSFKDRKEVVKEEDIKAFFAGMKPKREPDGVYFCR